jgi:calpain
MEDFTGGITELYDMLQPPRNLFKIMLQAFQRNSLMGSSIDVSVHCFVNLSVHLIVTGGSERN